MYMCFWNYSIHVSFVQYIIVTSSIWQLAAGDFKACVVVVAFFGIWVVDQVKRFFFSLFSRLFNDKYYSTTS